MTVQQLMAELQKCQPESEVEVSLDLTNMLAGQVLSGDQARFDIAKVDREHEDILPGRPALVLLCAGEMTGC